LLASGTLAPLASFAQELRLPFPHRLENPHVINASKQVFACVLGKGVSGKTLNSSYSQRDNEAYKVCARISIYFISIYSCIHRIYTRVTKSGSFFRLLVHLCLMGCVDVTM